MYVSIYIYVCVYACVLMTRLGSYVTLVTYVLGIIFKLKS